MEVDIDLDREKAISDNEPLMALLEEVEKRLGNPEKRRVLVGFEETLSDERRTIRISYSIYTLGFTSSQERCTFSADRDYNLQGEIHKS